MRYFNAQIYGLDFRFYRGGFAVESGRFAEVGPERGGEDLHGAYVIPGLIDVHNHGNSGFDFSDGTLEGVTAMARYLAKNGITSFAPASLTLPEEQLSKAYKSAKALYDDLPEDAAAIRGIHMEGPFFSYGKRGAQNPAYLKAPDAEMFFRLQEAAGGLIRIADVAPELPGAMEFIRKVKDSARISIAHTESDYETAKRAIDEGVTHLTHLYNAMPGLHHRNPGVIGACAEDERVTAELICDGKHVHPSAVRAAFALFGAERICLISDALSACGMAEGEYVLSGQEVVVKDELAHLRDGTIAGAASNLFSGLRKAVRFGIRPEDAVRAATYNPARAIGALDEVGTIETGKSADFLVLNGDYSLRTVCLRGRILSAQRSENQ